MLIKIMYIQFLLVILFDVLNLRQDFFGVFGGEGLVNFGDDKVMFYFLECLDICLYVWVGR